ncbi:MAG: DODA-type extradiol aromatic ring-opening family dioxygenase [Candidatus Sericytochromatia bacterium]
MTTHRLPTYFIPHGGGPCFFMDWNPRDAWDGMAAFLRQLRHDVGTTPQAVLVISGHWETDVLSLTSAPAPELLFDYYGFPEHTYQLTYPAPGSPELAAQVAALLGEAGIPSQLDGTRGFDHGVFIPFKLVYPEAEIPVVQLSLRADLDPAFHLAVGRALAPLREQGVLIIGSGMSYHNLRRFGPQAAAVSQGFDDWLNRAVAQVPEREALLTHWTEAPHAREAHPREEHLLPLMVVAGAASGESGQTIYQDTVMGMALSGHRFG